MGELPMAGGWSLSALWMPMCGQRWLGAAATFTGMWSVMMVPMMLPVLAPALWRYGGALINGGAGRNTAWWLAAVAGAAWACVWAALGLAVYSSGAIVVQFLLQYPAVSRLVPVASSATGLAAAAWHLASWRRRPHHRGLPASAPSAGTALLDGVRMGVHCVRRCSGLTVAVLVAGAMDWRVMACGTGLIAVEHLAPLLKKKPAIDGPAQRPSTKAGGSKKKQWMAL
ncbi:MAG TPA: DUF2182 domain-containing protein [Telluria sp.]|nr:DUF2182 domain-containing protein [Telluria sp.]